MRITETEWLPTPPHQVWEALMDPEVLQKCIPGCVKISRCSPTEYHASVSTKIGGMKASYEGEILLSDVDAPNRCTLAFEGKGEAAGLVIGTAEVDLSDKEEGTRLHYVVSATTGGKLSEFGDKVCGGAAATIISKFMTAFTEHAMSLPRTAYVPPPPPENAMSRFPILSWAIPIVIVAALMGYHTFFK